MTDMKPTATTDFLHEDQAEALAVNGIRLKAHTMLADSQIITDFHREKLAALIGEILLCTAERTEELRSKAYTAKGMKPIVDRLRGN